MAKADRRASSWATRSMSRPASGENQMCARSARSRPATSSPSAESASRASDNAREIAVAEAAGARSAKSSSRATSRPTRRPGLTITSSQRRFAGGRYQGPALRSPSFIVNGPSRVTRSRSLELSVPLTASPATAHYPTPTGLRGAGEHQCSSIRPAVPRASRQAGHSNSPSVTTKRAARAPTRLPPTRAERFRK